MKLTNHLDFGQLEARNAVLQNLATAPSTPKVGQVYYNTATNVGFMWNGTVWRALDATALAGVIPLAALATDPLARANHTGTQLAATISNLAATVQAYTLNQFAAPAANIPMAGFKLTGLAAPTTAGDSAEYSWVLGQVQAAAGGIDSKPSCRILAAANQALTGLAAIDGVTPGANDRILCVGQTTASQNGPWIAAAGAWTRPTGAVDTVTPQAFWFIEEGTTYGGSQWKVSTTGTITLGTTSLTIVQFGASTSYAAGAGLQLVGSTFSVKLPAASGLVADGTGTYIDTAVVVRKFAATVGDGSSTSLTVTHNLGTQDVQVWCRDASTQAALLVDWSATTTNTLTLAFAVAPAANSIRVVVQA